MAPRPLASVWAADGTAGPWLVTQTPSEVAAAVREADLVGDPLIELTLANPDDGWAGRPLFVRGDKVDAISPSVLDDDDV